MGGGILSDEEPDISFVVNGTKTITQGNGILAMFCPHDEYCPKEDLDANCFYEKFLHCGEARQLELIHQLSQINKFYLRYKDQLLMGQYPIPVKIHKPNDG